MIARLSRLVLLLTLFGCGISQAAEYNFLIKNGKYFLVLMDANGNPKENREVTVLLVSIDGTTPPGPPVVPPIIPIPVPNVPDGAFGLTKAIYTAALKIPDRSKAKALADNYESVGAALAAGGLATIDVANVELKTKNNEVLGSARESWLPFFTEQAALMKQLFIDGKVRENPQYAEAYKAIANGLRLAGAN